ncbi:MAG: fused response regulator/phosphatase [Spirochaetota bacterium]|jgi:serine phosphatase RsbU (regulator of sigma subunit)|nr:fused response regulator/phosphatase [Spirochaetota bacterium]
MKNEKPLVILVDDDPANLKIGKNLLSEKYRVATAPSAARLFELLECNNPVMILLDIMMPEMDGYETIKVLKSKPKTLHIPVIFLTAMAESEDELMGLTLGAVDYITKPFQPALLLKRIEVHLLVEEQRHILERQAAVLKEFSDAMEEELFLARKIQQLMFSSEMSNIGALDYHVAYSPLNDVGGDFYSISEPRASCLRVFLADVIGHGVPAALISMLLKSEYEKVKALDDPIQLLQSINNAFVTSYRALVVQFTGVLVDIDTAAMSLRYITGGHPYQCLVRNSVCTPLIGQGKIIGVVPDPNFSLEECALQRGDRIMLFTDGLIEQTNSGGEEYGEARLMEFLTSEAGKHSCMELNQEIMKSLNGFQGEQNFADDVTLICIQCL